MAQMKVIFPHHDDAGVRHEAGDYREVPDHMVERYTMPYPGIGFKVMVEDEVTRASMVGYTPDLGPSLQEELDELEAAPAPAMPIEEPAPEDEAPASDDEEALADEPKGKKSRK